MSRFPHVQFLLSVASPSQFPADHGVEVAIAGRSNAGKSSAINAIMMRRSLARTSKTPGQTRLLNYFQIAPGQRLVDLPGYGYASVPEAERRKWVLLIDALRERASLLGLFLVVDARRGLSDADMELVDWATVGKQRLVHVLLSKADKLSRQEGLKVLRESKATLEGRASVQLFSAHEGTGVEEAQKTLTTWLAQK